MAEPPSDWGFMKPITAPPPPVGKPTFGNLEAVLNGQLLEGAVMGTTPPLVEEIALLYKSVKKGNYLTDTQVNTLLDRYGQAVTDDIRQFLLYAVGNPQELKVAYQGKTIGELADQIVNVKQFSPDNPFLHANAPENISNADRMAFELRSQEGTRFPMREQRILPYDVRGMEGQLLDAVDLNPYHRLMMERIAKKYTTSKAFASPRPWLDLVEDSRLEELAELTEDYTPAKLEELRDIFRRITPMLMKQQGLPDPINVWRGGPMGALNWDRLYDNDVLDDVKNLFRQDPAMMLPTTTDKNIARSFSKQHADRFLMLPGHIQRGLRDTFGEALIPGVKQFQVPHEEIPWDPANLGNRMFSSEAEYTIPLGTLQKRQLPYVELGAIKPKLAGVLSGVGVGLGLGALARKHTDEETFLGKLARRVF